MMDLHKFLISVLTTAVTNFSVVSLHSKLYSNTHITKYLRYELNAAHKPENVSVSEITELQLHLLDATWQQIMKTYKTLSTSVFTAPPVFTGEMQ